MARGQYLEIKVTGISPAVIARVYSALWGIFGCVSCRIRSEVVGQKKGDVAGRACGKSVAPECPKPQAGLIK